MQYLYLLFNIRSIIDRFNRFYSYLFDTQHTPFDTSYLRTGQMVSRISKGESFNLYGLVHCQHFGVVVEDKIIHLLRDGYHISTVHEFMEGEKLLHVYHCNPKIDLEYVDTISYSLVLSNCEHFASFIVDGVMRCRQLEVMEWLAMHDTEPPSDLKLIPTISLYI